MENSKNEQLLKNQKIDFGRDSSKPLTLTWSKINISINETQILQNISGYAKSGECLSILGASGSGKSTLINIISGNFKKERKMKFSGEIFLNGNEMNFKKYNNLIGFVMQQDIFLETMTIEEIFKFVIDLREPKLSTKEKEKRIDSIIRDLRLEKCRKNVVGGRFVKGISGGEKRRLNIGFELLKNPKILFLDEPTSGLDSYTGFIIIKILQNLAKKRNMLIVYTIHQPSLEISNLFENVMILNKGQTAYFDKHDRIETYYSVMGYPCPEGVLIYDHILDVSVNGGPDADKMFFKSFEKDGEKFNEIESFSKTIKKSSIKTTIKKANYFTEFGVLFKRSILNFWRNPMMIKIRLLQVIFVAILILLLYWRLDPVDITQSKTIQNRLGACYFLSINLFMMYFQTAISTYPAERKVFRKEYNSGLYGVSSYFLSKLIIEIPLIAIFPVIFTCLIYYGINFIPGIEHFLLFGLGGILISITSTMLGIFYSTFVSNIEKAIEVAPLIFVPFLLFSGFTTNTNNLIAVLKVFQYISPIKYSFEYLVTNEFEDLTYLKEFNPIKVLNFTLGIDLICYIFVGYSLACIFFSVIVMRFNSKPIYN